MLKSTSSLRFAFLTDSFSGQVSEQEKMALELILGRLQSLKTTIQVDQFFPRAYFQTSSTSLPHNCANGSTEIEPSQTWPTLRNFSKKYAYLDTTGTGSWATHTLKELDNYQVYDAVDIRNYYSLQQQSVEPNDGEPEGNENPSGSKPHRVASLEEVELQTETEKPVHDGAQMAHAAPKKKSKLKSVLGFGSKKNKGAGRLWSGEWKDWMVWKGFLVMSLVITVL